MSYQKKFNQVWLYLLKAGTGLTLISLMLWLALPDPLFRDPTSTVVFDREGRLIGARIASDGQWRFPAPDSIPGKFSICIRQFEDRHFYSHPGINPFSLLRALQQNIRERKIVSGGSTLTMQVIRLSRKGKSRSINEKIIEMILAVQLELRCTKDEILRLYAGNAPFGGNVVGMEAASWRYFERNPWKLSWAESAMLAVLPNSPSLIHPGKNRQILLEKRNRLLYKLLEMGYMDSLDYSLAILEEIPVKPPDLPDVAYHLTQFFDKEEKGKKIYSSIDLDLQYRLNRIFQIRKEKLYSNMIRNAACLVVDASSGEIISYVGNIRNDEHPEYGGDVDIVRSPRSTGSILKPFLYAEMQYRGELLPQSLVPDIPTRYASYSPKNYNRGYDGVVKASESLSRSLNVPSVRMLSAYGTERFLNDLKSMGFSTLKYSGQHYGLSLILGGAEVTLWDLARVYTSLTRVLNSFNGKNGGYYESDWDDLRLVAGKDPEQGNLVAQEQGRIGAGSIWLCFEALRTVNRPDSETGWDLFNSSRKLAWKTGTSFGFRDGWAVACTPQYVVAVWTGNANGEGRPGLTGINTAAPLLFEVLNLLPPTGWFEIPYDDLRWTEVCHHSGHKAGIYCPEKDSVLVSPAGLGSMPCPYHRIIHLDISSKFRVNSDCYPVNKMISKPWFILPPAQEWFHSRRNSSYKLLPPLMDDCESTDDIIQIQLIYPDPNSVIYIPRELDGEKGKVVFEAAHRQRNSKIFWSVDNTFITYTESFHQISVQPQKGKHILTLVDEKGNRLQTAFEVIDRKED